MGENQTDRRCSACKVVWFCSPTCQKLIWDTHEFLCGKDTSVYYFPPLSPEELVDFSLSKHRLHQNARYKARETATVSIGTAYMITLETR
ncbi:hypothetical protein JCM11641_007433 [Rhodosporidiobolus odoratus]